MPESKTEPLKTGEALITELPGTMSRDTIVVAAGQNLGPNAVCGKITATGKYVAVNPAASDGSQVASLVLRHGVNATAGDKKGVGFTRFAELNSSELDFGSLTAPQIATAKAQLTAATLFVREAV